MLENMSEEIKKETKKQKLRGSYLLLKKPQAILRMKLKWRKVLHAAFCEFL